MPVVTFRAPKTDKADRELLEGEWVISKSAPADVSAISVPVNAAIEDEKGIVVLYENWQGQLELIECLEEDVFLDFLEDEDSGFWISWSDIIKCARHEH